jgi:flagellar biosynthetic protein FliQ
MNQDTVVHLATQAMMMGIKVSAPFLLAGLVVGLVISIFQAATQIQEITLTFIPKMIVTAVVIVVAGPWMLDQLVGYTQALYLSIPLMAGPGP